MYPLFMGFMHMLSPVLPGLVEESWENRPAWMLEDGKIPHPLHVANGDLGLLKMRFPATLQREIEVLNAANTAQKAAQEEGRADKVIGSSLASRVVLDLPEQALSLLNPYEKELEDIFVVSEVSFGSAEGVESEWVYKAGFETEGGRLRLGSCRRRNISVGGAGSIRQRWRRACVGGVRMWLASRRRRSWLRCEMLKD